MERTDLPEKILIVDDNKQNIEILMNLLKDEFRIVAAVNGERAIKLAKSDSPPDLILLDIIMPEMDGYQICEILKNDIATRNIPIIFITAVSEIMDATKGFALGAADYITKPFHPPFVKARIRLQLNLKRKQELLEEYAFIDALTEIPNRRRFDELIVNEWNKAIITKNPLSLLMIDLDHFKMVNDTYGHGCGDEVLQKVSKTIRESLQQTDTFLTRYGGEEFVVILPSANIETSCHIAEIIKNNIENLKMPNQNSPTVYVTVSIGAATVIPDEKCKPQDLIDDADKALYLAKKNGRNRIEKIQQ